MQVQPRPRSNRCCRQSTSSPRNCRVDKGVPAADASVWLDAKPDLIRKAQAMGLMERTENLARIQAWKAVPNARLLSIVRLPHV